MANNENNNHINKRDMISVTFLSAYLWCPRQLHIEQVLKIRAPPKPALAFGCVRHSAYEEIGKSEEGLVRQTRPDTDENSLKSIFYSAYSKALRAAVIKNKAMITKVNLDMPSVFRQSWQYLESEAITNAKRIYDFMKKRNVFGDELWLSLTPKLKTEYRIESGKLMLKGIIDRLEVYKDRLVPVELKTGKAPKQGVWPSHRVQIAAYLMLLQAEKNNNNNKGVVYYLDQQEKREIILNEFMKDEVIGLRQKVSELLKSTTIPGPCHNDGCPFCKIKELPENRDLLRAKLEEIFNENQLANQNL